MNETLSQPYTREAFLEFLNEFLPSISRDTRVVTLNSPNFKKINSLGSSPELDLQLFEVEVSGSLDKRVAIATDAFRLMKSTASYRTLVAFHSDDSDQWRLSFMTAQPTLKDGKVITKLSSPRRFSYLLGPESKLATPTKQLISKGKVTDYDDLSKRFAVEVVNNEFYKELASLYDELIGTDKTQGILKYPESGEQSHEFAVRLIGRIIFCWFLREKRSAHGVPLVPEEVLSRKSATTDNYYHSTLAPLFFEVLNKNVRSREVKFQEEPYSTIPYLNGGLFNPDIDDHYKFDKSLQLSVPGLVDVPDTWLRKLFDLLELYNFTIDENTSYDIDLSIDPEMLGRIFENLLARINPDTGETVRRMTGSFYTPREIVEHMVDESIKEYLKSSTKIPERKLIALTSFDLSDDEEEPLTKDEKAMVTEALNKIKVLDPACGSGAFPIGILQKIVFMLQQVDPEAKFWFEQQIVSASPELKHHLEREFNNKNFDYLRKLGIIRESIYGVDIQPIATEISRLRCFLTLVVDQSVDDSSSNLGVEPLPNLDFKFVTANSLIPLEFSQNKKTKDQTGLFEDQTGISELRSLRDEYFTSHNHDRERLKLEFTERQNQMLQDMISSHSSGFSELTQKLSTWKPFSHKATGWFDPEWMFGISEGFDIVIGNPPYFVYQGHNKEEIPVVKSIPRYDVAHGGKLNAYKLFLALSPHLTKENGVIVLIFQNSFLADNSAKKIRQHYLKNMQILKIDSFPERDNHKKRVFENVKMSVCVMVARKSKNIGQEFLLNVWADRHMTKKFSTHFSPAELEIYDSQATPIPYLQPQEKEIFKKCYSDTVPGIITCLEGELNMTFHRDYFTADSKYPKIIKGAQVLRYRLVDNLSQGKLEYLDEGRYLKDHGSSKKSQHHNLDRIAMQGITGVDDPRRLVFAKVRAGLYCANSCNYVLVTDEKYPVDFILALFNSYLLNWIFKKTSTNSNVNCYEVENLPIPIIDNKEDRVRSVVELVDRIDKEIHSGSDYKSSQKIKELEKEIDAIVYSIYGLSREEIKIIEANQKAS